MNSKIRFFIASALISVLLICLCSCTTVSVITDKELPESSKSGNEYENKTVKYEDFTAEEWLATVETVDYENYDFNIVTSVKNVYTCDEDASGAVEPKILERNKLVEEKFNINIKETYASDETIYLRLMTCCKSGKPYGDLLSFTSSFMAMAAGNGYIMNLYSLPFFNEDAIYIDENMVSSLSVNNNWYAVYDTATLYYGDIWCILYNKKLIPPEYNIPELIRTGNWTWDKFSEISLKIASETLSKRSPDYYTDVYGYGSGGSSEELISAVFASSGKKLFTNTRHNELKYSLAATDANKIALATNEIVNSKSYLPLDGEDSVNAFLNGRLGFFIYVSDFCEAAVEKKMTFGIAPMPKMSAEQSNYSSYVGKTAHSLSVSVNQPDVARTARILQGILAASYSTMKKSYLTNVITFCLTNNEDAMAMQTVFDNAVFDISVYSPGFQIIEAVTTDIIKKAVTTGRSFGYLYTDNASNVTALNKEYFN